MRKRSLAHSRRQRRVTPVILALVCLHGCSRHAPHTVGPVRSADTASPARGEPWTFLGLPDEQERKIGDVNPAADPVIRDIVELTKVRLEDFRHYEQLKEAGTIRHEEPHGGFVYYATEDMRHADPATVFVTERFKTPLPFGSFVIEQRSGEDGYFVSGKAKTPEQILRTVATRLAQSPGSISSVVFKTNEKAEASGEAEFIGRLRRLAEAHALPFDYRVPSGGRSRN